MLLCFVFVRFVLAYVLNGSIVGMLSLVFAFGDERKKSRQV